MNKTNINPQHLFLKLDLDSYFHRRKCKTTQISNLKKFIVLCKFLQQIQFRRKVARKRTKAHIQRLGWPSSNFGMSRNYHTYKVSIVDVTSTFFAELGESMVFFLHRNKQNQLTVEIFAVETSPTLVTSTVFSNSLISFQF